MFPAPTHGNPAGQVNQLWNAFTASKVNVGMVWIDVEGTEYWMGAAANQAFMKGLLDQFHALGAKVGIYASKYQWNSIFGSGFSIGSSYPLWYAYYNGAASCSDFGAFGGWSTPTLKQYLGDVSRCGLGVDISSYC
jgi:hypothetical protein